MLKRIHKSCSRRPLLKSSNLKWHHVCCGILGSLTFSPVASADKRQFRSSDPNISATRGNLRNDEVFCEVILRWSEPKASPLRPSFSYCRLLPPREISKLCFANGMVGRGGGDRNHRYIEKTQCLSALPTLSIQLVQKGTVESLEVDLCGRPNTDVATKSCVFNMMRPLTIGF